MKILVTGNCSKNYFFLARGCGRMLTNLVNLVTSRILYNVSKICFKLLTALS